MAIFKSPPLSSSRLPWRIEDLNPPHPSHPLRRWSFVLKGVQRERLRTYSGLGVPSTSVSETYSLVSQAGFPNSLTSPFSLLMMRLGDLG